MIIYYIAAVALVIVGFIMTQLALRSTIEGTSSWTPIWRMKACFPPGSGFTRFLIGWLLTVAGLFMLAAGFIARL